MNAFAGIRPKGGSKPDPLAFFPGVCSGGYLFSSGGPTPTTPRQFLLCHRCKLIIVDEFAFLYLGDRQTHRQTDGQTRYMKPLSLSRAVA